MIFSRKRTIIFIDKEKIKWAQGSAPDGKLFGEVKSLPWSEKNLDAALSDIENSFPRKIRIVIGEELSYTADFKETDKKNSIINDAQSIIPEKLQDGWDTREEGDGNIQIAAIQQNFFAILKKNSAKFKLNIEAMESESISICRMADAEKGKAIVFISNRGDKIVLGAARNGSVLAAEVFFKIPNQEQIQKFIEYVSSRKNVSLKDVYIDDETKVLMKIFQSLKFNIQEKMLDPMIGICRKKDIFGRDKDILNIFLDKSSEAGSERSIKEKKFSLREKVLIGVFIFVITAGLTAVYYMQKYKQQIIKTQPVVRNTGDVQAGLKWEK